MRNFLLVALPVLAVIASIALLIYNVAKQRGTGGGQNKAGTSEADSATQTHKGNYSAVGMCLGMVCGVILGATGVVSLANGLAFGMFFGLVIGMLIKKR